MYASQCSTLLNRVPTRTSVHCSPFSHSGRHTVKAGLNTVHFNLYQHKTNQGPVGELTLRGLQPRRNSPLNVFFRVKATSSEETSSVEPNVVKKCSSGSIIGAMALITGSTIGAGMLALPQATAAGGFIPSAGIMLFSWLLLTSEALLMAEVNLSIMEKHKKSGKDLDSIISLKDMATETLGPLGGKLSSGLYLGLANTLLVAYISKGGELLDLLSGHSLPGIFANLIFTIGLGTLLWKGSDKTVDHTNRILTTFLLFLFGGLLVGGAQSAEFSSLLHQQDWSQELNALPVVFLALVYHDLVPVICKYLGWNKIKIRTALICGSLIPFSLFLAWDAVALALVPGAADVIQAGGTIDPIRVLIETQGDLAGTGIGIFSLLAVVTSFMGTTISLSEFMKTEINKFFKRQDPSKQNKLDGYKMDEKLAALCLALGPPFLAAFSSPGLFFAASRIAGGYGMTLLYGILPPVMAWYDRHPDQKPDLEQNTKNLSNGSTFLPGGRPVLASLTSFAASIELGKIFTDCKGVLEGLTTEASPLSVAVNVAIADIATIPSSLGVNIHLGV